MAFSVSARARPAPVAAKASAKPTPAAAAIDRRAALGLVAGAAALAAAPPAANAAYGDAARVFGGKATNTTGFVPYSGEGFALLLPSKWGPRRQVVAPGVVLSYEDNGDAVNHVDVIARKGDLGGSPDKFLNDVVRPLLGEQVFTGETRSEGGFRSGSVSAASLLNVEEAKDKSGKTYYKYEILTRTADGNEGGRHHLIAAAAAANGVLYICHTTIGDKRWFKGEDKSAQGIFNSFSVA